MGKCQRTDGQPIAVLLDRKGSCWAKGSRKITVQVLPVVRTALSRTAHSTKKINTGIEPSVLHSCANTGSQLPYLSQTHPIPLPPNWVDLQFPTMICSSWSFKLHSHSSLPAIRSNERMREFSISNPKQAGRATQDLELSWWSHKSLSPTQYKTQTILIHSKSNISSPFKCSITLHLSSKIQRRDNYLFIFLHAVFYL